MAATGAWGHLLAVLADQVGVALKQQRSSGSGGTTAEEWGYLQAVLTAPLYEVLLSPAFLCVCRGGQKPQRTIFGTFFVLYEMTFNL